MSPTPLWSSFLSRCLEQRNNPLVPGDLPIPGGEDVSGAETSVQELSRGDLTNIWTLGVDGINPGMCPGPECETVHCNTTTTNNNPVEDQVGGSDRSLGRSKEWISHASS